MCTIHCKQSSIMVAPVGVATNTGHSTVTTVDNAETSDDTDAGTVNDTVECDGKHYQVTHSMETKSESNKKIIDDVMLYKPQVIEHQREQNGRMRQMMLQTVTRMTSSDDKFG